MKAYDWTAAIRVGVLIAVLLCPFSLHAAGIEATVKIGLCGDGIVDTTEECDGEDLAGASCSTQGYSGGSLTCRSSCEFNTSACTTGSSAGGGGGRGPQSSASSAAPPSSASPVDVAAVTQNALRALASIIPPPLGLVPASAASTISAPQRSRSSSSGSPKTRSVVVMTSPSTATAMPLPNMTVQNVPQAPRPDSPRVKAAMQQISNTLTQALELANRLMRVLRPTSTMSLENIFSFDTLRQVGAALIAREPESVIRATITPIPSPVAPESRFSRVLNFFTGTFRALWF
jgi:hypothetical protein